MQSITPETTWTKVIKPSSDLFDLKLKELWRYRDLLFLFVKRDFVAFYKQTILGPLWHFIQPALNTLVSILLFNVIAKIPTNGINPVLFQLSGIILWNYFSVCFTSCSNVFIKNANIFGKVYFPRLIMPLSIVLSNLVQFAIQFLLLLIAILYFLVKDHTFFISWSWLLIPIYLLLMAGISLGLGIIISSLTTQYRDLAILITFGVQLLMYASAVNYPLSILLTKNNFLYHIIKWNPLALLIDGFRNCILKGIVDLNLLTYPLLFMLISLLGGILLFNRVEKTFMDTV